MSPQPPTPEQLAAIAARDRDAFCEAGAGSGKTRVLVERYCEAVATDGVPVESILAFTFTERAAAELRGRIRAELSERSRGAREAGDPALAAELRRHARATERAWVTTIHGFCRRVLAAHPVAAGLDPRFRVLDESEAARLRERAFAEALAELMEHGGTEIVRAAAAYRPYKLAEMTLGAHARLRSQGMAEPKLPPVSEAVRSLDPAKAGEEDAGAERLTPAEAEAAAVARAALEALLEGFGHRYERRKAERSGLDFADLELRALALLRDNPAVGEAWRERFAHVLVDEFQDTNRVQLDLIEELRGPETRLFCVGDEHQSIYRFRNADLAVFRERRELARRDEGTEVLALRGNFRSRPAPLAAVNEIGDTLLEGFSPLAWARPQPQAGPAPGAVELLLTQDERAKDAARWKDESIELDAPPSERTPGIVAEARGLARRLRELVDAGEAKLSEIVVLLRAFTHVDAYEDALARAGLEPYVVGGRGYWSQQQVEDLVRLLGCVANPLDDELLFGALASPAASVGPDALWLLRQAAKPGRHIWPLVAWRYGGAEREPHDPDLEWLEHVPAEDALRLERFCAALEPLRAEAALIPLDALVERVMTAFGYDLALLHRPAGAGRMANVRKLMRLAREFERHEGRDLAGFLEAAGESARRDEREGMAAVHAEDHDGVRVMTVHAAKGLEFPVVAVPGLGSRLAGGHTWADVVIGTPSQNGDPQRFGMRLFFPSADSFGLWELVALNREEQAAEAEEGCRLVYVAATRAEDRLILSGTFKEAQLEPAEPSPGDSPLRRLLPRLVELGWAGDDQEVALATPTRADGAELAGAPETLPLRVRVSRPSREQAERLRERFPAAGAGEAPELGDGPPPLLGDRSREVPVGHLSYSALAEYERCGYRFYLERLLGVREGAAEAPGDEGATAAEADELTATPPDELFEPADDAGGVERNRALAFGNAVHEALEWSARNGWREPEGVPPPVTDAVRAWLGSELRRELDGWRIRPEVPFVVSVGGTVIRGQMDLLAEGEGGERCVVDFKTDALGGRAPAELGGRYVAQREVYALAAASEGARVRTVHLFLEAPDNPVIEEFDAGALDAARDRLGELIARIRGGEFAPTAEPSPTVCFACPAAARLCPVARWRPPPAPGAEASAIEPAEEPTRDAGDGAGATTADQAEHVQARLFD